MSSQKVSELSYPRNIGQFYIAEVGSRQEDYFQLSKLTFPVIIKSYCITMSSANVCYNLVGFLSDAVRSLDGASAVSWWVVKKSMLGMLFLKIFRKQENT